jgi:hypothetical protein
MLHLDRKSALEFDLEHAVATILIVRAELLESLEFLALFRQLAEFLDEVRQPAEESAADLFALLGLAAPLGCLGHRVIVCFQTGSFAE